MQIPKKRLETVGNHVKDILENQLAASFSVNIDYRAVFWEYLPDRLSRKSAISLPLIDFWEYLCDGHSQIVSALLNLLYRFTARLKFENIYQIRLSMCIVNWVVSWHSRSHIETPGPGCHTPGPGCHTQYLHMGWLWLVGSINYKSLLQKRPTKETIFCKRDL